MEQKKYFIWNGGTVGGKEIKGKKEKKIFPCRVPNFSIFGEESDIKACFALYGDVTFLERRVDPETQIPIGGWFLRLRLFEAVSKPPLQVEFEGEAYNCLWPGRPDTRRRPPPQQENLQPAEPLPEKQQTEEHQAEKTTPNVKGKITKDKQGHIINWEIPSNARDLQNIIDQLNEPPDQFYECMDLTTATSKRPLDMSPEDDEDGSSSSRTLTDGCESDAGPSSSPSKNKKQKRRKKKLREKPSP